MRLLARLVVGLVVGLVMLVLTAVGMVFLTAAPATASCAEPSADFLDTSDVAFSGAVTGRREAGDDVITTVRVDQVFKGNVTRRVDVVSPADEVDSSLTDGSGNLVIVFGQLKAGEVTSSLCLSVTGPGTYYREILADLGEGSSPTSGYMLAERRGLGLSHDQFSAGRAVLGALGLVSLAYFAFRAWRARRRTPR